ncbi:MAG: right-handed parallel beta-helix repeat-containing protein [Chloroflexi bacterium]|nr:right-handed parallel beta-helix repeat-containing protein [Chloroflexota bacterium]
MNPSKKIVLSTAVGIALLLAACSASQSVSPLESTSVPVPIASTSTPTARLTAAPTSVTATPTGAPSSTPTDEPTTAPTGTLTPTPTITVTPTRLNSVELSACATIWEPGYYKLIANIKTPEYDCIYVQSHNVVFDCDNHTIEGNGFNGYAVFVRKWGFPFQETPTNVEIKNCRVSRHRNGIFVNGANNVYIHHNDLSNNRDTVDRQRFGIFLGMTEGGGLRLDGVSGGRVEFNTTNAQAIGIDIRDSDRISVRNNTTNGNSAWGISLLNTSNSQVSNNVARDNIRYCAWGDGTVGRGCDAGGIILQDGASNNVISENTITGENGNGVFIKAHGVRCGNNNVIQGNKIIDAIYNAIEFSFCRGNRVIGNELSGSYDAVWFGFSANTEIRGNVIRDMRNHGIISYNSQNSIVADNQIVNSREGIYFYWDKWNPKEFYFLTPTTDNFASRDNSILDNLLRDNAVAGIRLTNSIQNRVSGNRFENNGRNLWLEGRTEGTTISNAP